MDWGKLLKLILKYNLWICRKWNGDLEIMVFKKQIIVFNKPEQTMIKCSALIFLKSFLQIFHNISVNKIFKIVYIILQLASFIPACTVTWISSLMKARRNTFFYLLCSEWKYGRCVIKSTDAQSLGSKLLCLKGKVRLKTSWLAETIVKGQACWATLIENSLLLLLFPWIC